MQTIVLTPFFILYSNLRIHKMWLTILCILHEVCKSLHYACNNLQQKPISLTLKHADVINEPSTRAEVIKYKRLHILPNPVHRIEQPPFSTIPDNLII